ncbi:hypothetical protein TCAL_14214 [Tigriopus californicus]|uniref:SCP domain-containing protein n=1 Tax=Tigriopus californicus TaxID=6832 RepID=A0A553NVJ6_TIGCA|nr:hypothetical protein TCAL_14214 [Tigriopus californicus]
MRVFTSLLGALFLAELSFCSACDDAIREKYCHLSTSASCAKCELGPRCPINGPRSIIDGSIIIRGLKETPNQRFLLDILDQRRISQSFSSCTPLFQWDEDLAIVAQAWADQ